MGEKNLAHLPELRLDSAADALFDRGADAGSFAFDGTVAAVFDDMIARSVPLYRETTRLAAARVVHACRDLSAPRIVELGAATGTLLLAVGELLPEATLVAVEPSAAMAARIQTKAARAGRTVLVEARGAEEQSIGPASAVLSTFTLQFLEPSIRARVLADVRSALSPGRPFVLAEKLAAPDAQTQAAWDATYDAFKRDRGYPEGAIAAKRQALRGVLQPWTEARWHEALAAAGFATREPLTRWGPFGAWWCT